MQNANMSYFVDNVKYVILLIKINFYEFNVFFQK